MKRVNFIKKTAVTLVIAAVAFTGCKKDDPVNISGISLNKIALTLTTGGSETLDTTITPANAENKAVSWKSDKIGIATVDADGKVTAVAEGTATITVTTADDSKTATCTVTVNEPAITMTTAEKGEVGIRLAGTGEAVIDWGDGSTAETVTLSAVDTEYNHSFSGTTSRTIAIAGQNITYLVCDDFQVTALDVTKNTALTELVCEFNDELRSLDVTKTTALTVLQCGHNRLTSLDVSRYLFSPNARTDIT